FLVANRRLRTSSEAGRSQGPERGSVHRLARAIDWNMPTRIDWSPGEQALLFEIDVRRPSTPEVRGRGPSGVAWALFAPGGDGGWRSRSSAAATGVAGGTTQTTFAEAGVWAFVLSDDGRINQGGSVEISFGGEEGAAATPLFAEAHEL